MTQDEIIRRLSLGEGFGNTPPERIDTHISTVFLIGSDVYKLKHAVATSYLDYSNLEDRHRFCQTEVDINRRTAPQIYLGVVPVRISPENELVIGDGPGTPVEWLVHMRRFPQEALLDRVADEGELTQSVMFDLADEIATFHKSAASVEDEDASRRIALVVDENEAELARHSDGLVDRSLVEAFNRQCRAHFEIQMNRIDRRGKNGFVRHCHGDLHLRNICLIDGKPTLFDAIEFSDDISHVDTLFDVAFLLMDLMHRGLQLQANALFNRYLYRTEDIDDLALLPLYLALRAGIRAHTSAMAATAANVKIDKDALKGAAMAYLTLGLRLLDTSSPTLIAVGGLSGTGKSTVAANIAPFIGNAPGAVILSSDLVRKRQKGVQPLSRLDETAYDAKTDQAVYEEILDIATRVLSDGHSIILDATFQDPARRRDAESVGRIPGVSFGGVWLEAASDELFDRVNKRTGDPSDATSSVLSRQLTRDLGEITWHRIEASGAVSKVAQTIREWVSKSVAPSN